LQFFLAILGHELIRPLARPSCDYPTLVNAMVHETRTHNGGVHLARPLDRLGPGIGQTMHDASAIPVLLPLLSLFLLITDAPHQL
jgi:hypothetical protein